MTIVLPLLTTKGRSSHTAVSSLPVLVPDHLSLHLAQLAAHMHFIVSVGWSGVVDISVTVFAGPRVLPGQCSQLSSPTEKSRPVPFCFSDANKYWSEVFIF